MSLILLSLANIVCLLLVFYPLTSHPLQVGSLKTLFLLPMLFFISDLIHRTLLPSPFLHSSRICDPNLTFLLSFSPGSTTKGKLLISLRPNQFSSLAPLSYLCVCPPAGLCAAYLHADTRRPFSFPPSHLYSGLRSLWPAPFLVVGVQLIFSLK